MPTTYTKVEVVETNGTVVTYVISGPVTNVTDAAGKVTGWKFKGRRSGTTDDGDVEITKDDKDVVWFPAT